MSRPRAPLVVGAVFLGLSACSTVSKQALTGDVRTIEIRDSVSPVELTAAIGDEIRWYNLRSAPVRVGLLNDGALRSASCQKGFTRFGFLDDFVTVPPHDYVSLCPSQSGKIQYNVWMNPDNLRSEITPLGTINVRATTP